MAAQTAAASILSHPLDRFLLSRITVKVLSSQPCFDLEFPDNNINTRRIRFAPKLVRGDSDNVRSRLAEASFAVNEACIGLTLLKNQIPERRESDSQSRKPPFIPIRFPIVRRQNNEIINHFQQN